MYMYMPSLCVCLFEQQRTGLKGRDKERMWKELLKILRPAGHLFGPRIFIPEADNFDPDTYGKPIEKTVQGQIIMYTQNVHVDVVVFVLDIGYL